MNRFWILMLAGLVSLAAAHAAAPAMDSSSSNAKTAVSLSVAGAPLASAGGNLDGPGAGGAATAVANPRARWNVLAPLASGLGLVWLTSSVGLGEGSAQAIMLIALASGLWFGIRAFSRRSGPSAAVQGALVPSSAGSLAQMPRGYSPKNVGNDASARPWETASEVIAGPQFAPAQSVPWGVPDDFDTAAFLQASKINFVSLQDAWDRSDMASLRAMMTDAMLGEIQNQLAERERSGAGENKTEVVMLEARLLGIEEGPGGHMASVEFSGLIREDPSAGPNPFREVWNITRPRSHASGWLVAGVQALQ
jgi:predicted lipid-binding transport protein (Tim44 family)